MTGDPARLPPELSLRILAEREPPSPGEGLYVLNRYLRERGDKNIKSVADLLANRRSTIMHRSMASRCHPRPGSKA